MSRFARWFSSIAACRNNAKIHSMCREYDELLEIIFNYFSVPPQQSVYLVSAPLLIFFSIGCYISFSLLSNNEVTWLTFKEKRRSEKKLIIISRRWSWSSVHITHTMWVFHSSEAANFEAFERKMKLWWWWAEFVSFAHLHSAFMNGSLIALIDVLILTVVFLFMWIQTLFCWIWVNFNT